MSIRNSIDQLRAYATKNGLSRSDINKLTGIHNVTLGDFFKDSWNPKLSTVEAIEKAFAKHKANNEE